MKLIVEIHVGDDILGDANWAKRQLEHVHLPPLLVPNRSGSIVDSLGYVVGKWRVEEGIVE